jgi:hypothetical protein
VVCTQVQGELKAQFEGGRNVWMSVADAYALDKKYASFDTELKMALGEMPPFIHELHTYSKEQF